MKRSKLIFLAYAISALILVVLIMPPEKQPILRINSPNSTLKSGENVIINFDLINVSRYRFNTSCYGCYAHYDPVVIRDSDGREQEELESWAMRNLGGPTVYLETGELYTGSFILNDAIDVSVPDRYRVKLRVWDGRENIFYFLPFFIRKIFHLRQEYIFSNEIVIEVVK